MYTISNEYKNLYTWKSLVRGPINQHGNDLAARKNRFKKKKIEDSCISDEEAEEQKSLAADEAEKSTIDKDYASDTEKKGPEKIVEEKVDDDNDASTEDLFSN